jgi:hypothetical protein
MTLTVQIPPETEQRLRSEAARLGVDEGECAKRLIELALPQNSVEVDRATLKLLAQWDKEDETNDPCEIALRNREFEELKTALNQNRLDAGGPDVRKVFP